MKCFYFSNNDEGDNGCMNKSCNAIYHPSALHVTKVKVMIPKLFLIGGGMSKSKWFRTDFFWMQILFLTEGLVLLQRSTQ